MGEPKIPRLFLGDRIGFGGKTTGISEGLRGVWTIIGEDETLTPSLRDRRSRSWQSRKRAADPCGSTFLDHHVASLLVMTGEGMLLVMTGEGMLLGMTVLGGAPRDDGGESSSEPMTK